MAKVRFEDVQFRAFVDDVELGTYAATAVDFSSVLEPEAVKYQGRSEPFLDSHYNGEQGSVTFELPDTGDDPQDILDAFRKAVVDRSNQGRIRIVISYRNPNTNRRRAYRFDRCQVNMDSRTGSGQAVQHTLRFRAESRARIQ